MKVGRMPVAMNSPKARPLASTPDLPEGEDLLHDDRVALHADDLGDAGHLARAALEPAGLDDQVDGRGELRRAGRGSGSSRPAMLIMVSSRLRASRGVLAWTVVIEPSWPVFMAWIMSRVSAPRHSPMMIRSGRIRRAFLTRSVAVTAPRPSMLAGRVSSRTTWSCWSWSSAASSIVMTRWSGWMKLESVFSRVVLPEPVPPEMMMLSRAFIAPSIRASISGVNALNRSRSSLVERLRAEHPDGDRRRRRGPAGGMMALNREPLGSRASTIGEVSSTRRPTRETIRSMIWSRCSLSRKTTSDLLDPALLLDEDLLRAVDHDVGDLVVLEQQLERAEAEGLVEDLVDQPLALVAVEQRVLGVAEVLDDAADLAPEGRSGPSR